MLACVKSVLVIVLGLLSLQDSCGPEKQACQSTTTMELWTAWPIAMVLNGRMFRSIPTALQLITLSPYWAGTVKFPCDEVRQRALGQS